MNLKYQHHTVASTCIALVLSACGSGNDNSSISNSVNNAVPENILGTVVIEERNGKTIFDAWFVSSQASNASGADSMYPNSYSQDSCFIESSALANSTSLLPTATQSTNWSGLHDVGGQLKISSRSGVYETLISQARGEIKGYSTDERWNSEPLPDDAILSFSETELGDEVPGVSVGALMPLVWTQPLTGFMSSADTALQWEGGVGNETSVRLKLSETVFADDGSHRMTTINCLVSDDGEFRLSEDMQSHFSGNQIVIYAVREKMQQLETDSTSIKVVQLSYASAVKP